jgi:hypothetical protein
MSKKNLSTFLPHRILLFLTGDNLEMIPFPVILFEPYVLLLMRKITKFVIFGKKYRYEFDIWLHSHEFGELVEDWARDPKMAGSRPACVL